MTTSYMNTPSTFLIEILFADRWVALDRVEDVTFSVAHAAFRDCCAQFPRAAIRMTEGGEFRASVHPNAMQGIPAPLRW